MTTTHIPPSIRPPKFPIPITDWTINTNPTQKKQKEDHEEDGDDNDDEEVEEEDIEEIEVEEEEEDDDEEDTLDSSKNANEKRNTMQPYELESKGPVGQSRYGTDKQLESHSTPEISKLKLASNSVIEDTVCDFKCSAPSNEPLTMEEETNVNYEDSKYSKSVKSLVTAWESGNLEYTVNKKDAEALAVKSSSKNCSVPHIESKAYLSNMEDMAAETTGSSCIMGKEVLTALSMGYLGEKANIVCNSKEEGKPVEVQSDDAEEQTASRSRLVTSEIRMRSLSPSAEFKDGKKRPGVICDFFARGWCIRGSSCRFLHVKNKEDDTNQQLDGDEAATTLTRESQFDEGVRSIMEKPKLPGFPDPMHSSFGKDTGFSCHTSLERIIPPEHGANQISYQLDDEQKFTSVPRELSWCNPQSPKQFPQSKDDPGFPSSFKDVGIENLRQSWPAAESDGHTSLIKRDGSLLFQKSLLPEQRYSLSGLVVMSSHHHSGNPSSYSSSLDNSACIRSTAWTGSSFCFSSSLHKNALGSQKLLDGDRDYHAFRSYSLLRTASSFSGSEPENLSATGAFGDQLCYAECKTKISSNDWEPSVPFRPSFFITPALRSSPGSQYDPVRDSFDSPDMGDKSFKLLFLSHGTSVLNSSCQPIYGDSLSSRTRGAECDEDTSTISYHNRVHGNMLDKNSSTPGKDSFTTGMVRGGTYVGDGKTEIAPKEESASGTYNDKDIPMTNKTDVDHDARHQGDVSRCKKGLKIDRVRRNNEMEVDRKIDGDVQKESKVLRHFRSSLVDFVKELLKPAWREGHLNKDAHNTIVKKAADKVLSTIQPHQIPNNMESIKRYLSLCQPKITKLVEGYITKYGKS